MKYYKHKINHYLYQVSKPSAYDNDKKGTWYVSADVRLFFTRPKSDFPREDDSTTFYREEMKDKDSEQDAIHWFYTFNIPKEWEVIDEAEFKTLYPIYKAEWEAASS